jgi:hypothetical protein
MASLTILHWIFFPLGAVIFVIPVWRIVQKAGFHGALSLLGLIPIVNIVLLWVFAFVKWPNERSGA